MGRHDSSKTRVAPIFDQLLARDATGQSWLKALLTRCGVQPPVELSGDTRLVPGHGRRWGDREVALPAPSALLEYLVRHIDPSRVAASRDKGEVREKRSALARRESAVVDEALANLRAGRRVRCWLVLEGPSRPDALLEAESFVVCIEGKRTEAGCTTHTQWMAIRSQLLRHMDAATEAFPGKTIYGLLVVEGDGGAAAVQPTQHWRGELAAQIEDSMVVGSLPHRDDATRERLRRNVLGVVTWQAICAATGVEWSSLPDAI